MTLRRGRSRWDDAPAHGCVTLGGRATTATVRAMTPAEERWWMGGFALVLDDVRPTPFVPCVGHLGFFAVPDNVARLVTRLAPLVLGRLP